MNNRFEVSSNRAGGFTLVEVMVAVLVLSVGLLGFAALQSRGLRLNHDALIRTQATFLANDMMDRMRTYDASSASRRRPKFGILSHPAPFPKIGNIRMQIDNHPNP